jgi:TRAP-type mannitol/chloroaromatic compound transport system permease large subunit
MEHQNGWSDVTGPGLAVILVGTLMAASTGIVGATVVTVDLFPVVVLCQAGVQDVIVRDRSLY